MANGFPGFIINIDERVTLEARRDEAKADLRALIGTPGSRVAERTAQLKEVEDSLR